jgi:hypothetical protein
MYQIAVIYSKGRENIQTFSIPRPSKIYPNLDFWLENIPSGNPTLNREKILNGFGGFEFGLDGHMPATYVCAFVLLVPNK